MRDSRVVLVNALTAALVLIQLLSVSSHDSSRRAAQSTDDYCSGVLSPREQLWDIPLLASIKHALDSDKTWQFERYRFAAGVLPAQQALADGSSGSSSGGGNVKARVPLIYCYIPKNACSMFKMLFLRLNLNDSEWDAWQQQHRDTPHYGAHLLQPLFERQRRAGQETLSQLFSELEARVATEETSSIMQGHHQRERVLPGLVVTRNPYVRLLSGYLDKVANVTNGAFMTEAWHQHLLKGHGFTEAPSFDVWVRRLHVVALQWRRAHRLNVHFKAQSHFCNMRGGVRFQYQIKLETLQSTYPCLVHKLGLGPWVDTQWSGIHPSHDCFYKPSPDLPCSWWRDALAAGSSDANVAAGGAASNSYSGSTAAHRTDATAALFTYYDQETARLATELYQDDLDMFGYQAWKGPPHPITLD